VLKRCSSATALLIILSAHVHAQGLSGKPGAAGNHAATATYLRGIDWADDMPLSQATFYVKSSAHDSALVKVVPAKGTQDVSWFDALKKGHDGYFTARIYNVESKKIPALNMHEADTGYVWVGQRELANRGAAIYVISATGASIRHKNKPIVGWCSGQHTIPRVRSTDGNDCPDGIHGDQPFHTASMRSMFFYLSGSGLWISCRGGCCEVRLT
jgi:hypothetical protein